MPSDPVEPQRKPNTNDRYAAFAALRYRDFRLLWLGQIVSVTGSQMQLVAIHWHVYLLTRSPLALGMVGLFRGAPIIICSLFGGVIADAVDRKRLMIATQTVMLACATLLTVVTFNGLGSLWPIYVLTGIGSAASAFDIPARQALMPTLVPAKDFPNAVSLGMIVFNLATIAGPSFAGLVLASQGPAFVYALNAVSFLAVILALLAMHTSGRPAEQTEMAARVGVSRMTIRRLEQGDPVVSFAILLRVLEVLDLEEDLAGRRSARAHVVAAFPR